MAGHGPSYRLARQPRSHPGQAGPWNAPDKRGGITRPIVQHVLAKLKRVAFGAYRRYQTAAAKTKPPGSIHQTRGPLCGEFRSEVDLHSRATYLGGMAINVEQEIRELKARLDKHDTTLAQLTGQFEFISGQLNAMQRFMHAKFDAIDKHFDAMDKRFDKIESDVGTLREDLPGIVVEAVRSVLRPG